MSNRQLLLMIAAVTVLSLVLAWTIERTQIRQYMSELDTWWEGKNGGTGNTAIDGG